MKEKSIRSTFLFFEAWFFLSIAKLMILFFPFKKIAAKIGVPQYETELESQTNKIIIQVQTAVSRGVKFVFFSSKCYDQALASTLMLKRRHISSTIYFGLNKIDGQLSAHAWVRCGQVIVSGKKGYENYTPVAWFGTKSM